MELKLRHSAQRPNELERRQGLGKQAETLRREIDAFARDAVSGVIPADEICAPQYKLRRAVPDIDAAAGVGALVSKLAWTNAEMWANEDERDRLVRISAVHEGLLAADRKEQQLNQDRNALMDAIDASLEEIVCVLR